MKQMQSVYRRTFLLKKKKMSVIGLVIPLILHYSVTRSKEKKTGKTFHLVCFTLEVLTWS